jgi:hypothetical protein
MRPVRKLPMAALLAIVAMALIAPSAAGQFEPLLHNQAPQLLVDNEISGQDPACPEDITPTPAPNPGPFVTTGGCILHVVSVQPAGMNQVVHINGVPASISTCGVEFDVRIDKLGEGYATHHEFTGSAEVCTQKPCGQPAPGGEGRAWSFFMRELGSEPRERLVILMCTEHINGMGGPRHCELTMPVSATSLHRYRLSAVDLAGHGSVSPRCELNGTFDVETTTGTTPEGLTEQNVEIRHN